MSERDRTPPSLPSRRDEEPRNQHLNDFGDVCALLALILLAATFVLACGYTTLFYCDGARPQDGLVKATVTLFALMLASAAMGGIYRFLNPRNRPE